MKAVTVITALVGVVVADVGIGYQYKVPHTSYGVPFNQYTGGSSSYNTENRGSGALGQNSHTNYKGQANSNFGGFQSSNAYQSSGLGGVGQSTGYQSTNYQSALPLQSVADSNSVYYQQQQKQQQPSNYQYQHQQNYQTGGRYQQQYQEYYNQAQQQPAQVFKHFYVHAAPPEPEVPQFRQPPVLPPPQKHYKIIFIKTPSLSAPAPQYVPVQQQHEEKTIVYVLVKKPEEAAEVVLPKIEQKKPTKPEVYFIKYNSKEGSQGVINNIVADYNNGQGGAVFDENTATSSIDYAGQQETLDGISEIFEGNVAQGVQSLQSSGKQGLATTSTTGSISIDQSAGGANQVQSHETSSVRSGAFNTNIQASSASSSNSLAKSGFSGGDVDSFSGIGTNQGLPHETYGPPKFSSQ